MMRIWRKRIRQKCHEFSDWCTRTPSTLRAVVSKHIVTSDFTGRVITIFYSYKSKFIFVRFSDLVFWWLFFVRFSDLVFSWLTDALRLQYRQPLRNDPSPVLIDQSV